MDHFDNRKKTSRPAQAGIVHGKPGGCRYERTNVVSGMPYVSLYVVPKEAHYVTPPLQTDLAFIKVAS